MVLSGSLNAPCKVNWESLPTGTKRSTRIWPRMQLPTAQPPNGKGQNRRQARSEDIELQTRGEPPMIVEQLAVRLRQQKPIMVCKDIGVVEKHRRYPPPGLEFPDLGSGEGNAYHATAER